MKDFLVVKYNGNGSLLAGPYIVGQADTDEEAKILATAYRESHPEWRGWNRRVRVMTRARYAGE